MNPTGLIIGGKVVPCAVPVYNWHDHGMEFKPGKGARRRVKHPDLVVVHWTGGEGTNDRIYKVLVQRGLGIEFAVDREGVVYQFADPITVDTFDAGSYNARSVGIETANYGFGTPPANAKDRVVEEVMLNGVKRKIANFYPKQLASLLALVDGLCAGLNIPRVIPKDADGNPLYRVMSSKELAAFHGVIGHYHITTNKSDPGPKFFDFMKSHGY